MARNWLTDALSKIIRVGATGGEMYDREALRLVAGDGIELTATDSSVNGETKIVISTTGGDGSAEDTSYDNAASGLAATDVQAAIDELAAGGPGTISGSGTSGKVAVWNSTSSLTDAFISNSHIDASAAMALSKLADGAAHSIVTRAANSSGAHADQAIGTDEGLFNVAGVLTSQKVKNANIDSAAGINLSKLEGVAALTVLANPTNGSAVPTAVAAASASTLFGRTAANTLGFFALTDACVPTNTLSLSKLVDGSACSIVGRSGNSSGAHADISIGTNDHVLMRTSNALTSGFVANANIDSAAAIALSKLASQSDNTVVANTSGSSAVPSAVAPQTLKYQNVDSGGGNIEQKVAPEQSTSITSLSNAANVNKDFTLSANGIYNFSVMVTVERAITGDLLQTAHAVFARRVGGTLTVIGTAASSTGASSSGLTVTFTNTSGNFRVNIANNTGETVSGTVAVGWIKQDDL